VQTYEGHSHEVCGLKWSGSGAQSWMTPIFSLTVKFPNLKSPIFFCLYSLCIVYQLSPVLIILSMFTDGCHIAVVKTYQGEKDRSKCFSFDVVFFSCFCCRLLSCLMLLVRTELHSQDMINEKLQKAEDIGMESFPCPLEAYTIYIQIFI